MRFGSVKFALSRRKFVTNVMRKTFYIIGDLRHIVYKELF